MKIITDIGMLKNIAKKRLPKMFFEYIDTGSWREITYYRNQADFNSITLYQQVGRNVATRHLNTELLGIPHTMPVALAPVGLTGMMYPDGELHVARAAAKFGCRYTLSMMSICSLEDVAQVSSQPFWFQLCPLRDRLFMQQLIERAKIAGCDALVITLDFPVTGQRHRDIRNGLTLSPPPTWQNWFNLLTKPRWCFGMISTKRRYFGNIYGHIKGLDSAVSLAEWVNNQLDTSFTWDDLAWIKEVWGGKIIVKGILNAKDAKMASECGVDAIIVSNHGGRQLDGAISSIRALSNIYNTLAGDQCKIWMDGGIASGQDVFKALASGAQATFVGRSYIYGLAALGEVGVLRALKIIQRELDLTMALCGVTNLTQINNSFISEY